MSHEIENMFSVNQTPWHKLGKILNAAPSIQEAIIAAGLDWKVNLKPLFTADGVSVESDAQATYRESDGKILGVVGPSYKPLQNSEAFNFFQPFVDSGAVELETAGSLRDGRRVWVLARVKGMQADVVKGDEVKLYVLLSNSHDGTLAIRTGFTPIRVVCNNTLTAAHSSGASKLIRIRHAGDVVKNLQRVQEVMDLVKGEFTATMEQYRALASKQVNQADLEKFVKIVFSVPGSQANANAGDRSVNKIQPLFEQGRGNNLPGVQGTMWALYNATTEYLQYNRGTDDAKRLDSTWFGTSQALNKRALDTALDLVKA
jgi:phage/plasmid-like protein (TIGR03299 family)